MNWEASAIPLSALIIAVGTFIATQRSSRRVADQDYVKGLEARIVVIEKELLNLITHRDQLQQENIQLMRQLIEAGIDAKWGRRTGDLPEGTKR